MDSLVGVTVPTTRIEWTWMVDGGDDDPDLMQIDRTEQCPVGRRSMLSLVEAPQLPAIAARRPAFAQSRRRQPSSLFAAWPQTA